MKRIIYILVVGLLLVFCSYSFISGDDDVSRDINQAICLGQSDHIAGYFAPEVVLGVQGEDHNCPKEQAELALKEFFRRNTPLAVPVHHRQLLYIRQAGDIGRQVV